MVKVFLSVMVSQVSNSFFVMPRVCCDMLQCLWRCHAAEHNSKFRATWRIHENDSATGGHHSTHQIAKSLGRLARRTTGSFSYASKKAWPRQVSKGSLMDASHVSVAECTEPSSHAGVAGDTFDIDDPVTPYTAPAAGIHWLHISDVLALSL